MCSDALNEVLTVFSDISRDASVINIIIPQIAGMKPLAVEAVSTHDFNMCRRITLIYSQLGNDYLSLLIDDSNMYKGELLDVGIRSFVESRRCSSCTPSLPSTSQISACLSGMSCSWCCRVQSPGRPFTSWCISS